jgi:DNA-binding CsgD family transcriptional regulator
LRSSTNPAYVISSVSHERKIHDEPKKFLRRMTVEVALVADYKTSKEIAQELFISPRTVDTHRNNICQKLEIHGSHALVKFALRHKDLLLQRLTTT